jgi:hypothetical protein
MNRRSFLRAAAATTFGATALRTMIRSAEAASLGRVLFVYTNAGRDTDSRCSGTGTAFTLGAGYAPLAPYQRKLLIVDGLSLPPHTGEEHPCGKASLFTGRPAAAATHRATGLSIDRYLARKLTGGVSFFAGTATHGGDEDLPVSWNAANAANDDYAIGANALATRLFARTPPAVDRTVDPKADDPLYAHLLRELDRLQPHAPASEREKLDLHREAIEQLRTASSAPPISCGTLEPSTLAALSNEGDRIAKVIATAFGCGAARIGVVRIGAEEPYHGYSHWRDGADLRAKLRAMDLEWSASFGKLLAALDAVKDGAGTLLDQTVIVWGSDCCGEFGAGNQDNGIHGSTDMPFVLAGGLGGKLATGRRVVAQGRSNVDLYRTIATALGTSATDFGDPTLARGPLTEILA